MKVIPIMNICVERERENGANPGLFFFEERRKQGCTVPFGTELVAKDRGGSYTIGRRKG